MSIEQEDEASIAATVAYFLKSGAPLAGNGWEVGDLDIGEVEISTPNGQRFRLIIEEITDEETTTDEE